MASKPGSIVHVELHSADPAKSKAFYGEVFGWKFEEMPEMNYTMWRAENEPGGGIMQTMEGRPPQVLNYILAESVEDTLRDIKEPGGTMMAIYEGRVATRPRPAARKAKKAAKKSGKKAKAGKKRK